MRAGKLASSSTLILYYFDYILVLITNLMHWLLFIPKILFSSTCFEPQVLIFRRIQLYTCSIWYCHSLWEFVVACRYRAWVKTHALYIHFAYVCGVCVWCVRVCVRMCVWCVRARARALRYTDTPGRKINLQILVQTCITKVHLKSVNNFRKVTDRRTIARTGRRNHSIMISPYSSFIRSVPKKQRQDSRSGKLKIPTSLNERVKY